MVIPPCEYIYGLIIRYLTKYYKIKSKEGTIRGHPISEHGPNRRIQYTGDELPSKH